jgi:tetratricopeptide (TPR) repeat protein
MLAQALVRLGRHDESWPLFEECLALARSMGYSWGAAQAMRNLALGAYHQGVADQALGLLEESVDEFRKLGATHGLDWALLDLGQMALARGDLRRAATSLAEGLESSHQVGNRLGVARCLEGLAGVAAATIEDADASPIRVGRLLGAASLLRDALGSPVSSLDRVISERAEVAARSSLGEEPFAAAWAEGRAMTLEQVVAYALDEPPSV